VFTVTLAVIDQFGRSAAASKTVNVSSTSAQLVADFTVSPTNPTISFGTNTVFFDATPSSPGVTIWTWDFGDGSSGTGQRPAHTYVRRGTWVVRLTVGDDAGRSATTTRNVTVAP
jgi:PKD repeat protein